MTASLAVARATDAPRSPARPIETADDFAMLFHLAEQLVPTGFLPDAIKTPGQAVAIILAGRELGLAPMQAFRSLSMVKGKITINADLLLARFRAVGGQVKWERDEDTGVAVRLRHPNGGDPYLSPFTQDDAKKAGLWNKPGPWQQYPRAMMRARAVTAGLKAIGWEPASGVYDGPSDELPTEVEAPPVPKAQPLALPVAGADQGYGYDMEHEEQAAQERAEADRAHKAKNPKPHSGPATAEQMAEIGLLVQRPQCRAVRAKIEARLKEAPDAAVAVNAIEFLRQTVKAGGGNPDELGLDDKRASTSAVEAGH